MADERIIERIKTLLRFSKSADHQGGGGVSVEETANAAAMAQRLMSKHQIAEADLGSLEDDGRPADPRVQTCMGDDGLYRGIALPFWLCRLAANLADLNSCDTFIQKLGRDQVIGLVGQARELSVVRYMFDYLRKEIAEACRAHPKPDKGTRWRTDFKLGAADEVIVRMRQARDDEFEVASTKALMRIDVIRKAATKWKEDNVTGPGRTRNKREADPQGYYAGRIAGGKINLDTGLALNEGDTND